MKEKTAKEILEKTKKDYNLIAHGFSESRKGLWPELLYFKNYINPGDKILDLGCGNGRLRALFKDMRVEYTGLDSSDKLIKLAKEDEKLRLQKQRFIVGDALDLPFKSPKFDIVFSIAVAHHIPSKNLRLKFLKEVRRVLKPEGISIVLIWNLWRKKFMKYHIKSFVLKVLGKEKLGYKDIFYPWKNNKGEVMAKRFLHCFTKKELVDLVRGAGLEVQDAGVTKDERNIYVVARPSLNG